MDGTQRGSIRRMLATDEGGLLLGTLPIPLMEFGGSSEKA